MRKRDEPYRWAELATYNAERARGLMHSEEWQRRMAGQQAEFDEEKRAGLVAWSTARGGIVVIESDQ